MQLGLELTHWRAAGLAALGLAAGLGARAETVGGSLTLPPYEVRAEAEVDAVVQPPVLPETEGVMIHAGKRSSVVDFDALPPIQVDNFRQAFARTPGLLTAEVGNASLLSLGYRGLGDPHESQDLLVLKDGIPWVLDPFGYPTVYFVPPFESLDRLEFIRGGAALQFGPQPAGALNLVSHEPRGDVPAHFRTLHTVGEDGLYSTFNSVEGGAGDWGYLASFDYRRGDGFRQANGDFELWGASSKLIRRLGPRTRLVLTADLYDSDHGEPGGLSLATGPGVLNYDADRDATQLFADRIRLERAWLTATLEHALDDRRLLVARVWGGEVTRASRRINGQGFGTVPTGSLTVGSGPPAVTYANSNSLNDHTYRTLAAELRYRHDWEAGGNRHTLAAGLTAQAVDAPISTRVGLSPEAEDGVLIFDADRQTRYAAVFAENLFRFGRLTVTPGARLERVAQEITELRNDQKTNRSTATPLGRQEDVDTVALFGLGLGYDLGGGVEAFGNVSQSYKPKTYADALPSGGADTASTDLEPGELIHAEAGLRSAGTGWLWWEAAVFWVDYDGRFGRVGSNLQNVGRSRTQGLDVAAEADLLRLGGRGPGGAALALYGNAQLLSAEFVAGPLEGRTPQYSPDALVRAGLIYRQPGRLRVGFLGTHLTEHFADDANTVTASRDFRVPAYTVWDLTADWTVLPGRLTLTAGVNNLFDEAYYARVRGNGVDPANGRNAYVGVALEW